MKKKVDYKLIKQKTRSVAKAIPLALAITLFSSVNALASSDVGDMIQVDMNGQAVNIDVNRMNNDPEYRSRVYGTLRSAFENGEEILYFDSENDNWLKFGEDALEGITLDQMRADPDSHIGEPDPNPSPY